MTCLLYVILTQKSYSFYVLKLHRLMSVKRNKNKYWFFIFVFIFIFCYISFTSLSLTSLHNKLNHRNTHTHTHTHTHTQPSHHEIKPIQNLLTKPQTPTHSTTHADRHPALQLLWLLVVPKISSQTSITVHVRLSSTYALWPNYKNFTPITNMCVCVRERERDRERERETESFQCWLWDPQWIDSVAMDWSWWKLMRVWERRDSGPFFPSAWVNGCLLCLWCSCSVEVCVELSPIIEFLNVWLSCEFWKCGFIGQKLFLEQKNWFGGLVICEKGTRYLTTPNNNWYIILIITW